MKKAWIVMMTICAAMAFTGCGKKTDATDTSGETSAPVEATTQQEETTTPPATQDPPGDTQEFKSFTGEVAAVSDTLEDMSIKKDGSEISFGLSGVDIETTFALEPGTKVTVVYKGEISGTDLSNARMLLVLDAQEKLEIQTAVGSVEDQAMSSFTIKTADKTSVSFLKNNCEGLNSGVLGQASDGSNGSGAMIKVTYVSVAYDAGGEANFPLKVEAAE